MAPASSLSEVEEQILLALWKLGGIGKNHVREDALTANLDVAGSEDGWVKRVVILHDRGFLQSVTVEGGREISLTPLGLCLLRQIEEDKLEELK